MVRRSSSAVPGINREGMEKQGEKNREERGRTGGRGGGRESTSLADGGNKWRENRGGSRESENRQQADRFHQQAPVTFLL